MAHTLAGVHLDLVTIVVADYDAAIEFFVRAQRFGLRTGLAPEVVAQRWPDRRDMSQPATSRDFTTLALAKMGVSRLTRAA